MEGATTRTPMDSAPAVLPPGARLRHYQIIRRLQRGGMAELYLARQLGAAGYEKIVALKRVLPHLAEDATFVRMFLNEARLAAGLDHGNIAHVLDFGSQGPEHFLVLEYVHGRSLLEVLRAAKHGGIPLSCALTVVDDVAAALHYAHERAGPDGRPLGLVHRDVSPSNVLVSFSGEVKLVDFGIAKATAHTRVTQSGAIKGKLAYMAPEQIRGEAVDRRADVFSLAVVAYELCTGRRCFVAPGDFALINRVAEGRYTRPSSILPDFPPALEQIIARGLSVDPDERFESARAFQSAVEDFTRTQGMHRSRLALSEVMHGLFGDVQYPTAETVDTPTVITASATKTTRVESVTPGTATRSRTSRGRIALVLGVGLGLGLGLGAPWVFERLGSAGSEPETGPGPKPGPGPGPGPEPEPEPEPEIGAGLDPVPASAREGTTTAPAVEPAASPPAEPAPEGAPAPAASKDEPRSSSDAPARRRPSRAKSRRSGRTPRTTSSSTPPAAGHEYLPPSRRSG